MQRPALFSLVSIILTALSSLTNARAQAPLTPARITQAIDERQLTVLRGHTYPLARAEFDQGPAAADLPMEHMLLVLSRSSAQEAALETLLNQQLDKASPQYHKWLTPQQFGQQFGAADQDIQTVTAWLESKGFQVNRVSNGKTIIDFSGAAEQVENAFHTEIHRYVVNGEEHWANASDPAIPAALAPAVAGIATLHNFYKKPQLIRSNQKFQARYQAGKRPQLTFSDGTHALGPGDFLTIYGAEYAVIGDGKATIGVVGRSNINVSDISGPNGFRTVFELPDNPPQVVVNGADPGDLGGDEEGEAVLDTTWAGAIAPYATVKLVVSKSGATDGVDLSELYIIDNNLADVMTESFGSCEANYMQAAASYYLSLAQQAAAQGITYVVAAGDSGAEGCDDPNSASATGPLSVNIVAATPYNIAVGGTEFHEGNGDYWSNGQAGTVNVSAIGYIPEEAWNESCTASGVNPCAGGVSPGLWAGGGGASRFFSKPSWQAGVAGIPNDGARDVPDVSFTAAGHDAYLLCIDGSCTPNSDGLIYFAGYAGTSAATPSFAGIMALLVQTTQSRQGQAAAELYWLAANDSEGLCSAFYVPVGGPDCIFNDITLGNNAVPGERGYGMASAAYQAGVGYDLATGLGSINIAHLMNRWGEGYAGLGLPIFVQIDQPNLLNSTFMGLSVFSGAALRLGAAITAVAIAIDGVPYGTATYGAPQPDFCASYPGTGCPNVGWSISVDTTQFSNGLHRLDVTATSAFGDHFTASAPFTVANWSTADPMIINIDNPGPSSPAFSGVVGFGGWAIDKTGAISSVSVSIDGVPDGNASYGGNRPDVCTSYSGPAGCPNVGWNFGLDTTVLADGTHTLGVAAFTATGQNTTVTRTFTTSNLAGNKIKISIDQPNAHNGPFSGPAIFGGWALDSTAGVSISSVSVSIDGVAIGNAAYGGMRADVCAKLPGRAGCPNVGWDFLFDTTQIANGNHKVEVTATSSSGTRATASSSFTVANTTAGSPLKMYIDDPPQNAPVAGFTTFAGWAIDDNGPITSVVISVDGAPRGTVVDTVSRPDVCAAYPGRAGCPIVGWTFSLDTTLIPDGTHTLAVTGNSSTGDQLTVSTTFTVANWTSGNPMRISIDNPNSQSGAFSGVAGFGGWAISDIAAITRVAISIDGVAMGNASYGGNRPDVCRVFPGRAGCPDVGWNFSLDTTALANGNHTMEVTATSSGGQSTTVLANFTVSNSSPILITIDQPSPQSASLNGVVSLSGWAIDTSSGVGIASVQILVDGVYQGNASYGTSRPDVCAVTAFAAAVGCPNVGWNYTLDTTLLATTGHMLEVRAISTTGQQATQSSPFRVTVVSPAQLSQ